MSKTMNAVQPGVTRRSFVQGAVAAGAAAALGALAADQAYADEAEEAAAEEENAEEETSEETVASEESSDTITYADTIAWDAEYDVLVLGMGFSGMISAMEAADAGASVLVCEKAEEGEAGGNSKYCAQGFMYGYDDEEATLSYLQALTGGRDIPEEMLEEYAEGIAHLATTMDEKFGMPQEEFVDWTGTPLGEMGPEYPEFEGADKIAFVTTHGSIEYDDDGNAVSATGYGDSYLYQSMKSRLAERADLIDVWYETPGTALIKDPVSGAVIGATVDRKGESRNVRALNGVCICTGGFECNEEMIQHYLNVINYAPIGSLYNTGDGILMCQEIGANLWHMSAYESSLGLLGCGYYTPEGERAEEIQSCSITSMKTGASIVVGTEGKRFGNEAYVPRHGHMPTGNGTWDNPHYPEKIFAIYDQTQMNTIDEDGIFNEDYRDTLQEFDTIAEAAEYIGCSEENLTETIEHFNFFAESGVDYEFDRDAEYMRAFDGEKYYVLPLRNLVLNTQGGPQRNADAQIVDTNGEPIPHLYSAGECGGITTYMYNGGGNVAECFIFGQIAGANAAAEKDALPAYEGGVAVESNPAHVGDETDLSIEEVDYEAEAEEGELVGTGTGIGGEFAVYVTVDESGAIASVEVGENSETEGIGSVAIEELPEQFIGLSTAEEIDAVDGVSGATITSNAIKEAIKEALGLE